MTDSIIPMLGLSVSLIGLSLTAGVFYNQRNTMKQQIELYNSYYLEKNITDKQNINYNWDDDFCKKLDDSLLTYYNIRSKTQITEINGYLKITTNYNTGNLEFNTWSYRLKNKNNDNNPSFMTKFKNATFIPPYSSDKYDNTFFYI